MLAIIGWLALIAPLTWASVAVFFTTVDTFSEGLLSGKWWQKLIGVGLWVGLIALWLLWLSAITIAV